MTISWQKRLLAVMLCLCMLFTSTAFAETADQPVIEILSEPVEEEPVEEETPAEEPAEEEPVEDEPIADEPVEEEPVIKPETDPSEDNSDAAANTLNITSQPKSVTVPNGATASVSVTASGDGLKYQWHYKDADSSNFVKSSQTTRTYSIEMNSSRDGRSVFCIITDSNNSTAMTNVVTLNMGNPLKITKQPASVNVLSGATAKTTVTASGDGLKYQWYYKDPDMSSYLKSSNTTKTYSTTMNADRDGRKVYCIVKDSSGSSLKSSVATLNMKEIATITKQPVGVTVASGETAKTYLIATGDGLTYTWYWKDADMSTALKSSITTRTYTTTMNSSRNGRQVYCVVKDEYGNMAISNTVTLKMSASFAITKQPSSVKVAEGAAAKTTVTATGSGLTYTWYWKDTDMSAYQKSSITTNTYSTTMDAERDGRKVYCVVKDSTGQTLKSNVATLSMKHYVKITKQPTSVKVANGATAKTTVTVTGDGLTYAWYWMDTDMTTALKSSITTNTYSTTMDAERNGRKVYCVITDEYGNMAITNTVTLSMGAGVAITKQPASVKVLEGETAKVSLTATGEGLTYQWYYKNADSDTYVKSSTTTNTYSITMTSARAGRKVYCVVTDKYGATVKSSIATLNMGVAAKITGQPVSVSAANGESISVKVTAIGDGLTYQWYYKDAGASDFVKSSTTTNTYSTTMTSARAGRQVYCVVTDQYGTSVTSNVATLMMETGADDFNYSISNGAVTITGYVGNGGSVAIPSKIEGYPVVSIGEAAFQNNETITAVTIPGSVQTINAKAFAGCILLRTLNLSEGLKTIGGNSYTDYYGAFYNCVKLTSVTIPSTVTSIQGNAFYGCELLSSLTFKASSNYAMSIGTNAFRGTIISGTLTIPAKVASIGTSAFYGTPITTLTIAAGSNLKTIGEEAFSNCQKLTTVTIPANVETVSAKAFANCILLRSLTLNEGLKTIGGNSYTDYYGAFYNCVKLTSVTIPSTVTSIQGNAFYGCELLSSLTLKASSSCAMAIGPQAFRGTIIAGTLTIPAKVASIGTSAFYGTPITKLTITAGSNLTSIGEEAFSNCQKLTTVTIPSNVQTINAKAFASCTALNSLTLSEGLKTIGGNSYTDYYGAFYNCIKLTSVSIPSTVTSIQGNAFYGCELLSSLTLKASSDYEMAIGPQAFRGTILSGTLTIPAKVASIGSSAFYGTPITTLKITAGNYLKTIGEEAFSNCSKLTTVTIPSNVETISAKAFANCILLNSLTLNEGLISIGGNNYTDYYGAFYNCVKLTSVTIPSTVTNISGNAFYGCKTLSSLTLKPSSDYEMAIGPQAFCGTALSGTLTIPAKVASIGSSAFYGTPITTLKITAGNYLKTIGEAAFSGCTSLTTVTIPANVETISAKAFASCTALRTLTLNEGLKTISGNNYTDYYGAFYNCVKLSSVTIPSTVTSIQGHAFHGCTGLYTIRLECSSADVSIGTGAFSGCPGTVQFV